LDFISAALHPAKGAAEVPIRHDDKELKDDDIR
jgi:hypothetical protein